VTGMPRCAGTVHGMRWVAGSVSAVAAAVVFAASAGDATLPTNATFADAKGRVELLTRSGGVAFLTARTRCGRVSDHRLRIRRGRLHSAKAGRFQVTGTVLSTSRVTIRVTAGTCTATSALHRITAPQ
jgi:hypothetical protein